MAHRHELRTVLIPRHIYDQGRAAALPLYRLFLEQGDTPRDAVINVLSALHIIVVRGAETAARKRRQKGATV